MSDHIPHLLSEDYSEPAESRGRETFLVSVLLHIAVVGFLVTHPDILFSPAKPALVVPPQEITQLVYQPPPRQQPLRAPPAPAPPPSPAMPAEPAQPRARQEQDALREPPPPPPRRIVPPDVPVQPRIPPSSSREAEQEQQRDLLAESRGGGGGDRFVRGQITPGRPEAPEQRDPARRPGFDVPQIPSESPPASLTLPQLGAPGRGTDALLREMARQRAAGQGPGAGLGLPGAGQGAEDPNFNLPGPQILSDTMGVNFDPYLLRVYLAVRRNWYSVIPEIARLGKRGRVVLQFHILRNGGVQQLVLEDGSGTPSMDAAAMSSIRLSDPFPPLPAEFPGPDVRLRFVYFYNMSPQ